MKAIVLIDNAPCCESQALECEHGLSLYIESHGKKIVMDTGASSKFADNAEKLGIDLNTVDYCVLSHAHKDHTGGLSTFVERSSATIYGASAIRGRKFYSSRGGTLRDITPESSLFKQYPERFEWVEGSKWLCEGVALVSCNCTKHNSPYGNKFQCIEIDSTIKEDNYDHELALAIVESDELTIFSPCSHSGVFNIIESAQQFTNTRKVHSFIGGFHIVDSPELDHEVADFTYELSKLPSPPLFYTGHCTTPRAITQLSTTVRTLHTGLLFNCEL